MASEQIITGVVLAGGRSRRLGRDKLVERVAGEPLIERVVTRLSEIAGEIVAVVADERAGSALGLAASVRVVADLYPGKGSLGGIYTRVAASANSWTLVVAGDMPFLSLPLLRHMSTLREGYDVVVPVLDGRPEPTHALYAKACLEPMQRRLEQDMLKITGFFPDVRVREVPEDELRRYDPNLLSFFNINTQEDVDRAEALAAQASEGV